MQPIRPGGIRRKALLTALDAAAETLGMTSTDITTAMRGGKTVLDLAREKNVDETKLRTAIADAEKAALDQALQNGKVTQAQADELSAKIKPENIDLARTLEQMTSGPGAGLFRGGAGG